MKHHCHNPHQIALLFLLFGLFFIESCVKDKDTLPTTENLYYYLTPEQIAQSPYFTNSKYDTLSFFNSKGDTFTFAKIKTDTSFQIESFTNFGSEITTIYNYQYLHNTYQTLKGDGKFEVWHKTNSGSNSIYININWIEFSYSSDRVGKDLSIWPFYEEYIIGNQKFNDVTLLTPILGNLINVYVNVNDGLITFINTQTNDTLQLIKK